MDYHKSKVLVTGADGFIGSHLAEALVGEKASVTALAAYNSFDAHGWLDDLSDTTRSQIRLVRGDIRDGAFVSRLVAEHDVVFHLAALIAIPYSYAAAQSYVETNVVGTLNVLEAARQHGTRRVVHTSTSEVYGTAQTMPISEDHPLQGQSPYSASKIGADMMAEAYARSFAVPVVTLRPFNTFGPRQSERAIVPTIIRQALDPNCAEILVGDISPLRDLTYVKDTARAFMAAGSSKLEYGSAYNAGSEHVVSIKQVLELIIELSGSNKPVKSEETRQRPANSEVRALQANATRFNRATGWKAAVNLREGLTNTIAWWRRRLEEGRVRNEATYMT